MYCSSCLKCCVRRTDGRREHASRITSDKSSAVTASASRNLPARRENARLIPPISSVADMNSRVESPQSHIGSIKPRDAASAKLHGGFIRAGEAAQCREGHRLVPVIERGSQRFLVIERRNDATEDGRHPQHHREAAFKADAADHSECQNGGHAQTES